MKEQVKLNAKRRKVLYVNGRREKKQVLNKRTKKDFIKKLENKLLQIPKMQELPI